MTHHTSPTSNLAGPPPGHDLQVLAYDPHHHTGERSRDRDHGCAQGGYPTCNRPPEFSVIGPDYNISACWYHLAGAWRRAARQPAVPQPWV